MKKAKYMFAWVTQTDVSEWAKKYLLKKFGHPAAQERYEQLRLISTLKGCSKENRDLLETMKGAWRKKKSRDNQTGKKQRSYVLSVDAGRQLKRLSDDYGKTKTHTLEMIIAESLTRENSAKADRKDEGVFKRQATILKRELNQALNELHEYKFRLDQAGVDVATPLSTEQQKKVGTLARARKNEVIDQLPLPPVNAPRTPKKRASTSNKSGTEQVKLQPPRSPRPIVMAAAADIGEQEHSPASAAQAAPQGTTPTETSNEVSQAPKNGMSAAARELTTVPLDQAEPVTDLQGSDTALDFIVLPGDLNQDSSAHVDNRELSATTQHDDTPSTEDTNHRINVDQEEQSEIVAEDLTKALPTPTVARKYELRTKKKRITATMPPKNEWSNVPILDWFKPKKP